MIQENAKLAECSKLSLYGCFLDVAVNGLSFDPTMKHVYLVPYNVKKVIITGKKEHSYK
ncbi:MAG: recombinase RecT [Chitinophagaceae bacterium]|nr:recombinase RecT [Chitinophagaceae bacterium]